MQKFILPLILILISILLISCSSQPTRPFPPPTPTVTVTSPPVTTTAPPITITAPPITITESIPVADFDVVTKDDLTYYLIVHYGRLETSCGVTYFTFDILENDSNIFPYDYWIQVKYDFSFFYDLKYDIQITNAMNAIVCEQLKKHQENLARAVISLMPNKKFFGGYYDSWYKYPELQIELITRYYYSWVNYTPPSILTEYEDAIISGFNWYSLLDDELTR